MRKGWNTDSTLFQFGMFIVLNTSFSILTFLILKLLEFHPPDPGQPLGAPYDFILYNNLLKAFVAVGVIYAFRVSQLNAIKSTLYRYSLFAVMLYFANGLVLGGVGILLDTPVSFTSVLWSSGGAVVFRIISLIAGMLVYLWTEKETTRETEQLNKKLELSVLRELKAKAELESLQAKVNPHFLYNSLNSIHTLIDQHPDKAKEMILLLSKLFRLSVNKNADTFISVLEELDLVSTYLAIEKVRFGERLQIDLKCDEALMKERIPKFILQPIVENAVKHGTSKVSTTGYIHVLVESKEDFIEMQVRDNGPPFREDLQEGYGLQSVTDRVRILGGEGSMIELVGTSAETPPIAGPWKYVRIKLRKR